MRVRSSMLMAAAGLAAAATTAHASFTVVVTVEVTDGADSWSQQFNFEANPEVHGTAYANVLGSLDNTQSVLWQAGNGATIHGLGIDLFADPSVSSNFNVSSGSSNSTFTIHSAIVNHPGFPSDLGRTEAIVSLTNIPFPGTSSDVTMTGLHGGNAFRAFYNGATIFGAGDILPGGTNAGTQLYTAASSAPGVYLPLGGIATSIESEFKFSLSPRDQASGSSLFEVIPSPSSAGLIVLAGLVATRRRR